MKDTRQDWHELISQPQFSIKVEKNVRIKMSDGVHIAIDIFRPDAEGKFPALLNMACYWKESQYLPIPCSPPSFDAGTFAVEIGDTNYLVPRGYANVIMDVRGTGDSEGEFQVSGPLEQQDGYEVIEWLARQPWCNGNVGMMGLSYFSWIQYLVAALKPPHLKAIFPLDGLGDLYRDMYYHGGMLNKGFLMMWGPMIADHTRATLSEKEFSGEELRGRVAELLQDEDINKSLYMYVALNSPKVSPVLFDALLHPFDGPFYWERSGYKRYGEIEAPTYCGARWDAWELHLPGGFGSWEGIKAPKKFLIQPRANLRPFTEFHDIHVRWFDHWLKGNDTGIMDEPPITVWVQGKNEWRYEHEWPLARTRWTKYYLRADGKLSAEPPAGAEAPDSFDNVPYIPAPDYYKPVPCVRYATEPLEKDLEITGPLALNMFAALTNKDGNWIVEIYDVAPNGEKRLLTGGWLKASFREVDPAKSKPYRPFHPFTRKEPVEPGEVLEYAIDIRDTCNVFRAGHRLEVVIKSIDHSKDGRPSASRYHHLAYGEEVTHTVYHAAEYPSYLLLPVIP